MDAMAINAVIDRIVSDAAFAAEVTTRREDALLEYHLTPDQSRAVVDALSAGETVASAYPALRRLAHFPPLFSAYSATATKKG
jgi:hypothetical protein